MNYYLTRQKKKDIAQNLIDIFEKNSIILSETTTFIANWILTSNTEKHKFYYDVWEIVLQNFIPTTRPILFRSTMRIYKKDRISSFTSSLHSANKFSEDKGYLIICDTNETLQFEEVLYSKGSYRNSFYPLVELLIKAKNDGGWGFSDRLLNQYIGEKEYIMKTNFSNMSILKYHKR